MLDVMLGAVVGVTLFLVVDSLLDSLFCDVLESVLDALLGVFLGGFDSLLVKPKNVDFSCSVFCTTTGTSQLNSSMICLSCSVYMTCMFCCNRLSSDAIFLATFFFLCGERFPFCGERLPFFGERFPFCEERFPICGERGVFRG